VAARLRPVGAQAPHQGGMQHTRARLPLAAAYTSQHLSRSACLSFAPLFILL
jgi:hypothetical protein